MFVWVSELVAERANVGNWIIQSGQDSQNQLFAPVVARIETHVTLLVVTFDVRYESSKWSMHILCWTVPSIWQRTVERQSLPVTGFLRVIYAILNASVILERNETWPTRNEKRLERNKTRLARNETRLARNETRLARNETRGGNLLLSGTVGLAHE